MYKYTEIADALALAIRRGDYRQSLPGVRILAQEFGVNTRTVAKALKLLAERGLVIPDRRRGSLLPENGPQRPETGRVVIFARNLLGAPQIPERSFLACLLRLMEQDGKHPLYMSSANIGLFEDKEFWTSCRVDGFIFTNSSFSQELAAQLALHRIPVVSANRMPDEVTVSWVEFDHDQGIRDMIEALIRSGKRRIALINPRHTLPDVKACFESAYRRTLERHCLYHPEWFAYLDQPVEDEQAAINAVITKWMSVPNPPEAILCGPWYRQVMTALGGWADKVTVVPSEDTLLTPDTGIRPRLLYCYEELGRQTWDVFQSVRANGGVIRRLLPMQVQI